MAYVREVEVGGRTIKLEFEKYAKQANGSVMVSSGGTQVLVTVCASKEGSPTADFFPLGVEYVEKAYAVGRVPGGYNKREGRPSDYASLVARVIDRPLRPCFPKGFKNETVITATVLSYEHGFSPVPLSLLGASTALMISDIPFDGPVAALRLGMKEGEYVIDPLEGEEQDLDLDLNVACRKDAVLMVEAGAKFFTEDQMIAAIDYAHEVMQPLFSMQEEIAKEIGKKKWALEKNGPDDVLVRSIECDYLERVRDAFAISNKQQRSDAFRVLKKEVVTKLAPEGSEPEKKFFVEEAFSTVKSNYVRELILSDRIRMDKRSLDEIRPISCEINVLKTPHGSALFTRGETQTLASTTLASTEDMQRSEMLWSLDVRDRFMLHYNFPPFSVGEAKMQRSPGRREIGHGTLARRALVPIIPSEKDFSYTIRVVSETLESNGSSSMATVCAGTMALLNAGIPIRESVAGIAMGLIKEGNRYAILSDILGDEDALGDMDFKVCGTEDAITALQMDIKISGITKDILKEALLQAKAGRQHILGKMNEVVPLPEKVSKLAPRIFKIKISQDKIKDLIGPGGKNIKRVSSESGAKIDIDDSGLVSIIAPDISSAQAAKSLIKSYTTQLRVGDVCLGRVVRILDFGAFVEIRPGVEGLCHISQIDKDRVDDIEKFLKPDDEVMVKVIDIDKQGRIKLSRKEAMGKQPE